jgi:hypothetical protein
MSDATSGLERIRVLVETQERDFKGTVYKPVKGADFRLSDHLNAYDRTFLCLSDVHVTDRGQSWAGADKREFIAIAVNAITYVTPLEDRET